MVKAIYPGSFDPVTYGHIDIIERAAQVFDELIIGVSVNSVKKPMFTMEERKDMLVEVTKHIGNVSVIAFEGLTVDMARKLGAGVIIRGLRAVTDFEDEMQIAQTNHFIEPGIETMFMSTGLDYAFLSSTVVKELSRYGSDVSKLVPDYVREKLAEKFSSLQ